MRAAHIAQAPSDTLFLRVAAGSMISCRLQMRGRGGILDIMHGRSCMTIDPRIGGGGVPDRRGGGGGTHLFLASVIWPLTTLPFLGPCKVVLAGNE